MALCRLQHVPGNESLISCGPNSVVLQPPIVILKVGREKADGPIW